MRVIKLTKKEAKKIARNVGGSLGKKEQKKLEKIRKIVLPSKFIIKEGRIQMVTGKCPKCGFKMTYAGYFDCSKCGYSEWDEEKKMKKRMYKNKAKYKDYEIPFWGEWLDSDCLERRRLVEKLPVLKELADIGKLPEKTRIFTTAMLLNSFFEDLASAVYTKIDIKKRKKKR